MISETGEALDAVDEIRARGVSIAEAELGPQQRDSDRVREYIARVMPQYNAQQIRQLSKSPKFQWCGVFALWCLHAAGVTTVPWELGRGFVYRLPRTSDPQPLDVFVGPGPNWHHGVVKSRYLVDGKPWLTSIEGNTPDVRKRDRPEPAKYVYYSVAPWILESIS